MKLLSTVLDSADDQCVELCLEALNNILQCGKVHYTNEDDENIFLLEFENQGCL